MQTIIFSDTHLFEAWNPRKFALLKSIIEPADRIIINGDFWDSYLTSFDRFVGSKWSELFPLLLKRKAIYIYGNHDPESASDERVKRFSVDQVNEHRIKVGNVELLIKHGQQFYAHLDAYVPHWMITPFTTRLSILYELIPVKLFGRAAQRVSIKHNLFVKQWSRAHMKPNQFLVIGHNDFPEIDRNNRLICTGYIRYGLASYLKIENDSFELVQTTY